MLHLITISFYIKRAFDNLPNEWNTHIYTYYDLLYDNIKEYSMSREPKELKKFWNWSEIMFIVYIISKESEKNIILFNKFLWHIKKNTNKIKEWDYKDIDEFIYKWNTIGRKNTNNKDVYEEKNKIFNDIIKLINKKSSKIRDEISLKKFRDTPKKKCPICMKHDIEKTNYHAGHIISRHNGGLYHINNMIPICQPCNLSMGSHDLDIYCQEKGIESPC